MGRCEDCGAAIQLGAPWCSRCVSRRRVTGVARITPPFPGRTVTARLSWGTTLLAALTVIAVPVAVLFSIVGGRIFAHGLHVLRTGNDMLMIVNLLAGPALLAAGFFSLALAAAILGGTAMLWVRRRSAFSR